MPTYAYIRVSTDDQSLGIESQRTAIKAYCEQLGLKVTKTFIDEGVSAWKRNLLQRKAGSQMVLGLRKGDNVVIAWLDRGWRSVKDFTATLQKFQDLGVNLHFTRPQLNMGTATGKLMTHILASFAEWESSMRSENTRAALALKAPGGSRRRRDKWEGSGLVLPQKIDPVRLLQPGIVYSYGRVSHQDSVDSGLGLMDQELKAQKYCEVLLTNPQFKDLTRGPHFQDLAISAFRVPLSERPSGRELNSQLKAGDHVVFARLDRAFRNVGDMRKTLVDGPNSWLKRDITVHFVDQQIDTSTSYGQIMITVLTLAAEMYCSITSERIRGCMAECRKQGRPTNGKVRIGTKTDIVYRHGKRYKKFVLDMAQVSVIRLIVHYRDHLHLNWHQIADRIEAILAKREGREPIPHSGQFLGWQIAKYRGKTLQHRYWRNDRCMKGYAAWPWIKEALNKGKVESKEVACA